MLRFLIIFLISFYLIGLVVKWAIRNKLEKFNKTQYERTKEGHVTVKYKNQKAKKIQKDEGEYVNYEEVKE